MSNSSERFRNLYHWNGQALEDVRFWCEPELTSQAIGLIPTLGFGDFDCLATFEARGFFLAGVAAEQLKLPTIFIRKHKRFYDKMDRATVSFTNWKNEPETLTILKRSLPSAHKVLIVDDLLDTGKSLKAGVDLLEQLNIEVAGAFYLLNAGSDDALRGFSFPIKSAQKHKLF